MWPCRVILPIVLARRLKPFWPWRDKMVGASLPGDYHLHGLVRTLTMVESTLECGALQFGNCPFPPGNDDTDWWSPICQNLGGVGWHGRSLATPAAREMLRIWEYRLREE